MSYKVAKKFWITRKIYPAYPHNFKRRFLDLSFILNNLDDEKSLLDIGCADCSMLILLRELTPIKNLYGVDISNKLMRKEKGLRLITADVTKKINLPETDICLCFGIFPYIFDDDHIYNILNNIKSNKLLVRAPCALNEENKHTINKFSKELGANYSAIYRTLDSYKVILSKHFDVKEVIRAYPDNIESKYGSKQYYFICKR